MPNPIIGLVMGREEEWSQSIGVNQFNVVAVDAGPSGAGAIIGGGMISQPTGYQIVAGITVFGTTVPGVTGNGNTPQAAAVLPLASSSVKSLLGVTAYVINIGTNPINLYPNSGDGTLATINGQAANLPVVLGVLTVTPFIFTPTGWWADGIGSGASGSIETIVSQGNIVSAGTTAGTATPITQALVNIASGTTGGTAGATLPPAKAGMEMTVANNAGGTVSLYPNGSDTINGSNAAITLTNATVTLAFCVVVGAWLTK